MKNVVVMSTLMMILPVASSVIAQESVSESREPIWSVGAGIGIGSYYYPSRGLCGLSSMAGLGLGCYQTYLPNAQLVVERKLNKSLYVMMQLTGGFDESDEKRQNGGEVSSEAKEVGAILGLRWVLNPAGIVKVSPTVALRGQWGWYNAETYSEFWNEDLGHLEEGRNSADVYSYSIGAVVGIVLERELAQDLFLRLESSLIHASYSRSEREERIETRDLPKSSSNSFSAGLAFNPSLQLRLQF